MERMFSHRNKLKFNTFVVSSFMMETILNRVKLNFFQACSSFGVNDFEVLRVLAVFFFFFERVAKSVQMYNKIKL